MRGFLRKRACKQLKSWSLDHSTLIRSQLSCLSRYKSEMTNEPFLESVDMLTSFMRWWVSIKLDDEEDKFRGTIRQDHGISWLEFRVLVIIWHENCKSSINYSYLIFFKNRMMNRWSLKKPVLIRSIDLHAFSLSLLMGQRRASIDGPTQISPAHVFLRTWIPSSHSWFARHSLQSDQYSLSLKIYQLLC